ncbi:MAG: pyruvate ferredoxin oxidoreductase [Kosmotoga sp.]|nr:MAG: pyruvate ferredoxin oxidoreductase [Kosmotoga sp.]
MKKFDIFMSGVGGQGIGLLSEALIRAIDYSGQRTIGADTHGLAQRGGMVVSHLRIGDEANSVLIMKGTADLVISLERHEALRAMNDYLRDRGALIYYDAVWQPLDVRLRKVKQIENEKISEEAEKRSIKVYRVFDETLEDPRTQNVMLIGKIVKFGLIDGLKAEHCEKAFEDLMTPSMLETNFKVFRNSLN